ncbi:hypothetical protein [Glycomyces sp. YM15]|uniref:hypothetical protein n=1 Tax=Glycomyces sp. YM15 TaxID=2800446 RepID=UPI001964D360|nr:hypothetical protein [Glycomyces sp. YM15]
MRMLLLVTIAAMHPRNTLENATESIVRHGEPIGTIVRDVVAEVEPSELPIVDGLLELDHRQVVKLMKRRPRKREQLGFGTAEIVVLIAPILWLALDEALKQIVAEGVKSAVKKLSAGARRVLRRPRRQVRLPVMESQQLELLRDEVRAIAQHKGLSEDRAAEIADALVSRIARGRAGEPPSIERGD